MYVDIVISNTFNLNKLLFSIASTVFRYLAYQRTIVRTLIIYIFTSDLLLGKKDKRNNSLNLKVPKHR